MKLEIVIPILVAMLVLRWRRVGMLAWAVTWLIALYVTFRYGFVTPIPASVINLYMGIAVLAVAAYASSSRERWKGISQPLLLLMVEKKNTPLLGLVVVLIPALVSVNAYLSSQAPLEAPAFPRTVHPAPPDQITVHSESVNLVTADNPYRELEHGEPELFKEHVENGRRVYYQNCFWCHGDGLRGDGMFAHGLNPIPTNFADPGVIDMLQESYLFWRISKGGPGLPEEGGPWDSAMPVWENFLTMEEIWDVVLFLYDFAELKPRAREEHHE